MSEIGLSPKMLVRDIMSSPVVTMDENETSNQAAIIMDTNNLGAVIVQNKLGNPIGIITERDIVKRVVAKNQKPDTIKAKEVMTTPLVTVEPEVLISDAARKMTRLGIRRLGISYKGNLVGIISSKDILDVMPELLEIMQERSRIEGAAANDEPEETPQSGYCDNCETYSESLKERNGQSICDECRIELEQEK
ncbi:CBS domain-containing protein [Candidatus Bathycorpusculum sp.]|uniref:CBS domain-containing protein n=1 Tax=Candidatus Bathycorpusculum sp. TaxID=2994959 RepID=UPI002821065A|nr:CBS domain-containing protein [Candidatus Termitimicrobium sp.]MCL2432414.1 CBS domain-containing protein [Candidatus Termitimicrobium sp.]